MIENIMLLKELSQSYTREGLDILQALRAWKESNLSPESIRNQVYYDVKIKVSSAEAHDLHKAGAMITRHGFKLEDFGISDKNTSGLVPDGTLSSNYQKKDKNWGGTDIEAKEYSVSKGRSELIPENIVNRDKIKFTPSVRMSMEKVDNNLYRSKTAAKYWMLKNKKGDDGKEELYLVAVNDSSDELSRKEARYKFAADSIDTDKQTPLTTDTDIPVSPDTNNSIETTPKVDTPIIDKKPEVSTNNNLKESPDSIKPSIENNLEETKTPSIDINKSKDISTPEGLANEAINIIKSGNPDGITKLRSSIGDELVDGLIKKFSDLQGSPADIFGKIFGDNKPEGVSNNAI